MNQEKLIYEKIPYSLERFFNTYSSLTANSTHHVLLESGRAGRYSIAGLHPFAKIQGANHSLKVEQAGNIRILEGKPLAELEKWMKSFAFSPEPGLPDFQGGAIGYISYDYNQYIEELPNLAEDDVQLPLLYFLVFDEWAVYDHKEECLWLIVLNQRAATEKLTKLKQSWMNFTHEEENNFEPIDTEENLSVSFTEEDFVNAVQKIQAYIREGDVFQVNLAVRQSKQLGIPPLAIYKQLRKLNPSPYMGYLHTPDFQIVCGSPELLIQKSGQRVGTRPIGGTRPRGRDDMEDQVLANELLENEKERAEHIMLVDLERNDLGRVCEYGSVHVDEFMIVEKYSHVMHLVSHVSGQVSKEKTLSDLIEAMFPGGTITGAPKIRTMEIIEELEPVKRGIYTGSLGWIGFNEDLHLNIVIRTMIVKNGMAHVQAGAGIVIDSNPVAEYKESLKKAEALWKAKELAEQKETVQ
ncbi:anthranilate synthase component I family protein [Lederbergia galactosidilytica]|uniref:Aminobenzoate synthetase n=1 Tax=Lederbergia galactosidilytica TaxID=217031 RepID=A0A177ZPZ7_9BACI|nr:anthranilate synthase component I family protein [Lederbergia galactosidilytica]KRG12983.1 aminobenzoate synthetase [Virgibacillus soli]MBP1917228.1 para-aminobenzoate synthetase component 1 [Lederbergia galactosidilytica]OAK70042.1 aminobenzoate synthetase [Lederbergia galactosidilytica]